jgi:hypothetical protein
MVRSWNPNNILSNRLEEKNWAEVRREEEEDLTSARGSYKSAQGG